MKIIATILACLLSSAVLGHGQFRPVQSDSSRPIEFPDTAEYQTFTVDLHTHSVFSDGHVWPIIRVAEAQRDGLDALAITEHLEWQPHLADIPNPDRNRAFEEAVAAAGDSDLIVIAGSEITRGLPVGHVNAVFIKDANQLINVPNPPQKSPDLVRDFYTLASQWPAQEAIETANQQGAFVFWNHPYWTSHQPDGIAEITGFHRDNAKRGLLHGIEIANGGSYSEEAFAIAIKHKLTIIGVSDVHNLIDWDYKPHEGGHRPVTLVFAKERTSNAIREALFERRTVVWFRNQLFGRKPHLVPLLQASLTVSGASYRKDSSVLDVDITNHSDAAFVAENRGKMTFMQTPDLIEFPSHKTTRISLKPGKKISQVTLSLNVLNALTEPGKAAQLDLTIYANTDTDAKGTLPEAD